VAVLWWFFRRRVLAVVDFLRLIRSRAPAEVSRPN